jgi:hypothetical protein
MNDEGKKYCTRDDVISALITVCGKTPNVPIILRIIKNSSFFSLIPSFQSEFFPMFPIGLKNTLAMAMFASFGASLRQRGVAVTAFSIATTITSRSSTTSATRSSSSFFASKNGTRRSRAAFHRDAAAASTTGVCNLRMSSVAETVDLEKITQVEHPAFEIVAKDFIEEYGAATTLYRHKKSGAELLSVSTDDDNKVFGITFRTPPEDSTGVPHILEHSVLCGSRKYKTKDPFVQLLQG